MKLLTQADWMRGLSEKAIHNEAKKNRILGGIRPLIPSFPSHDLVELGRRSLQSPVRSRLKTAFLSHCWPPGW